MTPTPPPTPTPTTPADNAASSPLSSPSCQRGCPHPLHAPAAPSLAELRASPHAPVVVTPNPMALSQRCGHDLSSDPRQHVPLNGAAPPFPFETDTFSGTVCVDLRGLPTSRTARVFGGGKRRLFHVVIQGRFRRRVAASSFCIGQEFVKPGNAPPWVGELVLSAAARSFSASARVDARGALPFFMNPLLAACQLANVSRAGEEPADPWDAEEDLRLWAPGGELAVGGGGGGGLAGEREGGGGGGGDDGGSQRRRPGPLPSEQRRRWCDAPGNLSGRFFEARDDLVWTFHVYQHLIDFASYRLNVGVKGLPFARGSVDLAPALDCQPLQLTLKDVDAGEHAMSLLVWHERLLYPDAAAASADAAAPAAVASFRGLRRGVADLFSSASPPPRKADEAAVARPVAITARA